ncbi:MAG: hypothetical protein RI894_846 [Bacteroidota bacterium]|jgi:hypothetical protein
MNREIVAYQSRLDNLFTQAGNQNDRLVQAQLANHLRLHKMLKLNNKYLI